MTEMAPESQGEPADVQIDYVWEGNILAVETSLAAAKVKVELDWNAEGDPGANLDILLSALPQILIQVHQAINDNEEAPGA